MRRALIWGGVVVLGLVLALALNTTRQAGLINMVRQTPAARVAELEPYWRLERPEGPGPAPLAVLLSGCDGVQDNMAFWAGVLRERGWATLIVDSHTPRHLQDAELWRLVCAGQTLGGQARAGDAAVALAAMQDEEGLTDERMVLGASHGGWSALELVNLANSGEVPPGLTEWPLPPQEILAHLSRMVLIYPYCGLLNTTGTVPWTQAPETLMILAEKDSVISTPQCLDLAQTMARKGTEMQVDVIAGADHAFDQRVRSPLQKKTFDLGQQSEALALVEAFVPERP